MNNPVGCLKIIDTLIDTLFDAQTGCFDVWSKIYSPFQNISKNTILTPYIPAKSFFCQIEGKTTLIYTKYIGCLKNVLTFNISPVFVGMVQERLTPCTFSKIERKQGLQLTKKIHSERLGCQFPSLTPYTNHGERILLQTPKKPTSAPNRVSIRVFLETIGNGERILLQTPKKPTSAPNRVSIRVSMIFRHPVPNGRCL